MAQSELAALDRVLHRLASTPDEKLAPPGPLSFGNCADRAVSKRREVRRGAREFASMFPRILSSHPVRGRRTASYFSTSRRAASNSRSSCCCLRAPACKNALSLHVAGSGSALSEPS